jgi:hypothetical protein
VKKTCESNSPPCPNVEPSQTTIMSILCPPFVCHVGGPTPNNSSQNCHFCSDEDSCPKLHAADPQNPTKYTPLDCSLEATLLPTALCSNKRNSLKKLHMRTYNLPTELKSFLTTMVDMIPDERSLSAISGDILIFAHRPRNGKAEYKPFCNAQFM